MAKINKETHQIQDYRINVKRDVATRMGVKPMYVVPSELAVEVVTHGGIFHADEVLAIALLMHVFSGNEEILVKRFTREELTEHIIGKSTQDIIDKLYISTDKEQLFIVDCGQRFTNSVWFDHHHNSNLDAASSLIAKKYFTQEFLDYYQEFFGRVSLIDTNKACADERQTEFSAIIRSFNNIDGGFDKAVRLAYHTVIGMCEDYSAMVRSEDVYKNMERIGDFRVSEGIVDINKWQKYAEQEGVVALLMKNKNTKNGQYVIISRDTKIYSIPVTSEKTCEFRHNSGFMAVYVNMEEALKVMREHQGTTQE